MPEFYRVAKAKRGVLDVTGGYLEGGRWNSPGWHVLYGSTCLAGSLLEVLAHAGRRQKLPGAQQCVRAVIPNDMAVEVVDETEVPGWDLEASTVARTYGDDWLRERRTAVLSVPAVTARPYGRNLVVNMDHLDYARIRFAESVAITWDLRLLPI